jgi:glycosyltransferase involved in cell wall biosynthesis
MSGAPAVRRIAVACAPSSARHDAIAQHSHELAAALARRDGIEAVVLERRRRRAWSAVAPDAGQAPLAEQLRRTGSEELVLQYNPFSYGHWGIAPGLLAELLAARRRRAARLVVVVHEPFVVLPGVRFTAMGAVQRRQLGVLIALADAVMATSAAWLPVLEDVRPGVRARVLPAGSNVPDQRAARSAARDALGAPDGAVVVATFGMARPQQLAGHLRAALEALLEDGHRVIHVNLGQAPDAIGLAHPRLTVVRPGPQDGTALARLLAAADLFLAPYADGASTRRTTLMAALQHGLCVIATGDETTDPDLGAPSLWRTPVSEPAAFASAARALAGDVAEREHRGRAGRELYERRFSWEAIAGQFLAVGARAG